MTDGPDLLAAILANPADDNVRLVYADWLQENGQAERAEFIRVQCAIAAMEEAGEPCELDPQEGHTCCEDPCPVCASVERYAALCERERNAWLCGACFSILDEVRPVWGAVGVYRECERPNFTPKLPEVYARRGFVGSVTCTAADWLAHGDAIRAAHPVAQVRLLTPVAGENLPDSFWRDPFPNWMALQDVFEEYTRQTDPKTGQPIYTPDAVVWADIFGRRWPGIEFELPKVGRTFPITLEALLNDNIGLTAGS